MKTRICQVYIGKLSRIALLVARKIAPCDMAFKADLGYVYTLRLVGYDSYSGV